MHILIAATPKSPVYGTEIYPKKHEIETLKDRDMKTVPAVD